MPDIQSEHDSEHDNAHDELEQNSAAEGQADENTPMDAAEESELQASREGVPVDEGVPTDEDVPTDEGVPIDEGLPIDEDVPADTMHWYIIHTYSGFERKVAESLKTRADAFGFAGQIGQILIPEEEVVELRNGKKVTSKRLLYPGYVVVQMEMNDELWHRVKDTPRVTGFVGGGTVPVPLSADEINKMLYRQTTAAERPRPKMTFEKGESVRIIDGPFATFQGKVDEINPERNTLRVLVTIFGRATPVELDFLQVEKTA